MAFCGQCGTQIQEGAAFCASCGYAVTAAKQQQQRQTVAADAPYTNPVRDVEENKGMAIIAYILFFIPLLTGLHKTSPYVKYHTNQGIALFSLTVIWSIFYRIIVSIITTFFVSTNPWMKIGGVFMYEYGVLRITSNILGLLWFIPIALCLLGIFNAATGKMKPLPIIGKIKFIK